jgi:hypothetical protein
MHPDQPRPSKPDLIVELTELSRELRNTLEDLAVQTIKFKKILRESNKAAGREPEVVAANNDLQKVLKRLNGIWDRARKPIIRLGKTSNYGEKLLAEFRYLSLRPNALEVLKFVEFLEVVLETDAPAPIADLGDNAQPQEPHKRPRGRPSKIPPERKAKALEVRIRGGNNRQAAKILYDTEEPTKHQRDSVSAILGWYCETHGIMWPLPKNVAE